MLAAVIPVQNEESRVGRLLSRLQLLDIDRIYVILNGSNEDTVAEVRSACENKKNTMLAFFNEPLGIDIPRAVGASMAYYDGAEYTLFVDGDMVGEIGSELKTIISTATKERLDLALVNCYPHGVTEEAPSKLMFHHRKLLNNLLSLSSLGEASPSHGPHLVSRRLALHVPWQDFAVPPTLLSYAKINNMAIDIACTIPHRLLGSSIKDFTHNQLIVETIIGDCLEAGCLWGKKPRTRKWRGKNFEGYHEQRRFDLLSRFLAGRRM